MEIDAGPTPPQAILPPAAPSDGVGTPGTDGNPGLAEKIERAAAGAVDQYLAQAPKKTRGKRGPDKGPRKPRESVPVAPLDEGPSVALLEEGTAIPLAPFVEEPAAFDEETARELVEIGLGLLNDGAAAIVRAVAKNQTGDEKIADEAGQQVRMSEKIEASVRKGAVACAKKYAVRLDYAPEMMLGGGLVIWAGQVAMSVRALKAKGAELRAADKREAA